VHFKHASEKGKRKLQDEYKKGSSKAKKDKSMVFGLILL